MIENIKIEHKGPNQSAITFSHSTGETTSLIFEDVFPLQAKEFYLKTIQSLLNDQPNLSYEDDLYNIFSLCFGENSLKVPIGFSISKNEDRFRIGKRIKEIREEKHIDAKTLSILTGIDAANLCRIEQGKQSVGIDVLSKIANALGYKVDFVKK